MVDVQRDSSTWEARRSSPRGRAGADNTFLRTFRGAKTKGERTRGRIERKGDRYGSKCVRKFGRDFPTPLRSLRKSFCFRMKNVLRSRPTTGSRRTRLDNCHSIIQHLLNEVVSVVASCRNCSFKCMWLFIFALQWS